MELTEVLCDKSLKGVAKRERVIALLEAGQADAQELSLLCDTLAETQLAVVLEAIEDITRRNPAGREWMELAQRYVGASSNGLKREAARIVGNLAQAYPEQLERTIEELIANAANESTVVRWSSAYALSRIIVLPTFAHSALLERLQTICATETQSGVKNQYVKALKKAAQLRT